MDIGVTVEGKLASNGGFEASQVLAKCPSKYEMKERRIAARRCRTSSRRSAKRPARSRSSIYISRPSANVATKLKLAKLPTAPRSATLVGLADATLADADVGEQRPPVGECWSDAQVRSIQKSTPTPASAEGPAASTLTVVTPSE